MAFKNEICVRNRPNMEARKILGRSFFSTFSLGMKSDKSQNKAVAPMALKQNRPIGDTKLEFVKSLQMMMLKPKMV